MIHYSVQTSVRIFVKGYGVLSLIKNTERNIGKNINKKISSK